MEGKYKDIGEYLLFKRVGGIPSRFIQHGVKSIKKIKIIKSSRKLIFAVHRRPEIGRV